ncbi:MAG: hypothetical protein CMF25_06790 [Kangiellaceae bacterium]|nr:hypothetical protein [Kangiellaceae bacterium]
MGHGPLSLILLMNDRRFPWVILVPQCEDKQEIFQLTSSEQSMLLSESSTIGQAMLDTFHGDKLNIGALGNVVSQLHLHHIVRFHGDPCWPAPVWGNGLAEAYDYASFEGVMLKLSRHHADFFKWYDLREAFYKKK